MGCVKLGVQVYRPKPQRVRLDSTTPIGYWSMNEEDLFQLGHSKGYREWWDVWNRCPLNRHKQKRMAFYNLNLAQISGNLLEWLESLKSEPVVWQGLLLSIAICARNVSLINRHKY